MNFQLRKLTRLSLTTLFSAASFAASAVVDTNPYQLIGQKNSFRLQPLAAPPAAPLPPSAMIKLQGLTTALDRPMVLMKLTLPSNVSECSVILGEGERAADVEVVQINTSGKTVMVLNGGKGQLLFLEPDFRTRK